MGSSERFFSRSSVTRWESTCFWNCCQSPPEITETLITPSSLLRSVAISASSDDLLWASVPSRSNTMSFFMFISTGSRQLAAICDDGPRLFRQRDFQQVHRAAGLKGTFADFRRQEHYFAANDRIRQPVAFEFPFAADANQHSWQVHSADSKR